MSTAIHSTAVVEDGAELGESVSIGALTVVHASVCIGDNSRIASHCVIGYPAPGDWAGKTLIVGCDANIRAHTVIYEGSTIGAGLETGHHVLIREGTAAGERLRAGTFTDVEGRCTIGDFCTIHSAAIVGQGSKLGDFIWMYPNTVLPNDPLPPSPMESGCTLGSGAVMCVGSMLQPGSVLGEGAYLTAMSFAKGVVPPGAVVNGASGRIIAHVTKLLSREDHIQHPWMDHAAERYPEHAHARLAELAERVRQSAEGFELPGR